MKPQQTDGATPRYRAIKEYLIGQIESGAFRPGDRVHSESELCTLFSVSRMTVNRALRELTEEHILTRVQGMGTYVAEQRPPAELLELRNIAEEIHATGRKHSADIHALTQEKASKEIASLMGLTTGSTVYHSVIVHLADGVPVQVENRYVNPALAPDYLATDFASITPNAYLLRTAPLSEVEHIVEAVLPTAEESTLLKVKRTEPCLRLRRRTWSGAQVATIAWLTHHGSYQFGTRFATGSDGKAQRKPIMHETI